MIAGSSALRLSRESNHAFIDRVDELSYALEVMAPMRPRAKSVRLRISGGSGFGKSTFTRELLSRFASEMPDAVCLYFEVPESAFDASALQASIVDTLADARKPTRRDPQQVPARFALSQYRRPLPWWKAALQPLSRLAAKVAPQLLGLNDVSAEPIVDLFEWFPKRAIAREGRAWDYIPKLCRETAVVLAIDGVQFLTPSTRFQLRSLYDECPFGLRLLQVDRTDSNSGGTLEVYDEMVRIEALPDTYTAELVAALSPIPVESNVARVIVSGADGNLKRVWFHLQGLASSHSGTRHLTYQEAVDALDSISFNVLLLLTLVGQMDSDLVVEIISKIGGRLTSSRDIDKAFNFLLASRLVLRDSTLGTRVLRTDHELVRRSVRSQDEDVVVDFRAEASLVCDSLLAKKSISTKRLERLTEAAIVLSSAQEQLRFGSLLPSIDAVIRHRRDEESFAYLTALANRLDPSVIARLPVSGVVCLLDAFQKTSEFHHGISFAEGLRPFIGAERMRQVDLWDAKYNVQLFDYDVAKKILGRLAPGSDVEAIVFNIKINLCKDDEARRIAEAIAAKDTPEDIDECVVLRNSAHLFDKDRALEVLSKARKGFRSNGSRLGIYTTLNNAGVAIISAGQLSEGASYLKDALSGLVSLDSNERYQPQNNLAVLAALEGRFESASNYFAQAKDSVPPSLRMDAIMLDFNVSVLAMLQGAMARDKAAVLIAELHERSKKTHDIRFQWALEWFHLNLRGASSNACEFSRKVRSNSLIGLEAYIEIGFPDGVVDGFLELSPHWRF